ncbi:hypothetical protein MJO29_000870 [Puccinia striiformis f. sp. tritici]|uniref:hypothetical protein n=1 Tax=Puccinia striiformis f. sp. tritici TaxID=168172 RepID=UPI002008B2EA|nr:hypothetical protein Pst134EA_000879 [Puccinia striiformis f. sp. tritici]KAH9473814.1 hypothetical protein Pst134EA_000879 [Puccinia striiformis f. sp. tritici]KAI7967593.1 hypothetical protein MJO29_000870 [Puccinia striiformis f. sp. tritici]KAI9600129.1 hypothetical protein KEM48_000543 [Puccinia striiformis f. sp. tritici PST-130]
MASVNLHHSQVLTRSRTLLFLSFRDTRSSSVYPPRLSRSKGKQRQTDDLEQEALLNNDDDTIAIDMESSSALPPRWVDFVEEVEELTDQIKPKMVQLDKLTAKHVLPGFTDRTFEEHQIEELTTEITQGFRKCQLLIRKIADCGQEMEAYINRSRTQNSQTSQPKYTSHDVTVVKNAQIAAATKVQGLSSVFSKRQRVYLQQLKGYEKPSQNDNNALFAIEDDSNESSSLQSGANRGNESYQQQEQLHSRQSVHGVNQDIEQRAKEIDGIAKSISELADMFKDLGNLVIDQGTLLDRIDYNVEQMSTEIRGAAQELKTATQHQKRSGKCRIIFLLVLLVFAAVLVLVYKPRHSDPKQQVPSNTSPPTPNLRLRSNLPTPPTIRGRRYCGGWKPC